MRVSAKVDYALRALAELAAAPPGPVKAEQLATAQEIPLKFLENILLELRRAEIVASQRGAEGGYRLARPADEISLADVIRAVEGPIATVRGEPARGRRATPARPPACATSGSSSARACAACSRQTSLADLRRRAPTDSPLRRTTALAALGADVDDLPGCELELLAAGRA